eukprot:1329559-Prorocentrum_lima.AAC.1
MGCWCPKVCLELTNSLLMTAYWTCSLLRAKFKQHLRSSICLPIASQQGSHFPPPFTRCMVTT